MGSFSGNGTSGLFAKTIAAFTIITIVVIGVGLGLSLAETTNIRNNENFTEFAPALPTKILDVHGTLITEFSADEKRELVALGELPRHLIHAVLSREDPDFYNHRGFSVRAIGRAVWGQVIGRGMGGGSTITQQVAGWLYTDRGERTIKRKVKELWWAFQMERRFTKNEILEIYLNYMPMGPGTFGVETTSKHFFGHSSREVTLAESAVLAVLLSGPNRFDPLRNPNLAMSRQRFVLERMIEFGYTTQEEADASFAEYWDNFDYTRASVSAYLSRQDLAPWFSEYVRRELDGMMYGSMNYYTDGFTVHTTMDLRHQMAAEKFVAEGLERANASYARSSVRSVAQAERTYNPIVDLLTLTFNLTDVRETMSGQNERRATSRYTRTINPVIDLASLVLGVSELKDITGQGFSQLRQNTERNVVEGALISIENETGYINAIVGGSKFDESNQLIRATQASVQLGSAFKSLYYSAAIDTRKFTAASLIHDVPIVFHSEDDTPYIPNNFGGVWRGPVLFYNSLALSLNIPSLIIMDTIGFDATIERSAALLGITDPAAINRMFPRVYPLALGITATSPLRMARAFAVFGNQGRDVTPIAIRSIEDRNGRVVFDVEREVRQRQRRMGDNIQVISPQNAYIMTKIQEMTVAHGSLAYGSGWGAKFTFTDDQGTYRIPTAGKTGTPQNWSDAWAIGYSPYYSTAVWYGFDRPGNSLGVELTGAGLSGPVWGDFMREIHMDLPRKNFVRPSTGIVEATVCARSGLLRNPECNQGAATLPFLTGTQPTQYCNVHGERSQFDTMAPVTTGLPITGGFDSSAILDTLTMPSLPPEFMIQTPPPPPPEPPSRTQPAPRNQTNRRNTNQRNQPSINNPFLDDEPLPSSPANAPGPFPDAVTPFVPNRHEEDDTDSDDELPSWNPLD